jgi:hypothetical protein
MGDITLMFFTVVAGIVGALFLYESELMISEEKKRTKYDEGKDE